MTLLYAILGVILALFSAFAAGHRKGKASAQEADKKETERVLHEEAEQRKKVESGNSPSTALDELRKDGWTGH
ncbi:hypothetical protein B488_05220 [Liberibacter crescens BT-1]|uniref:Uncharacterized protein n=1 Tax=Liberibacter crescens (strain BT-1) TaxID=1215343 RepID=L0ESP3_LIBCB|nr:hypothetical protein [Liberibacter crescens]AGA64514.1 hypothetical protein B488_05220 [Liberibacter crescens BT-1]AMC12670.1 hypothetical protein RL73_02710 [Liberibacter crescens]